MLSLFRINDPYRLIFIFLMLLVIRIPMIWLGIPMSHAELVWLTLGEKLSKSGVTMYLDVWDTTGALASGTYYVLHILFGKSLLAYRFLALLLVMVQAVIFNNLLIGNKAYNENTMLPALFYVVFSMAIPDMITLSPVLMGLTFVLLALGNIFKRIDNFTRDDLFLYTGLYLGVATLFYLPFAIYFLLFFIALLLFTSAVARRMVLLAHGFFLVMGIGFIYYYMQDAHIAWWRYSVVTWWQLEQISPLGWSSFIYLTIIMGAILVIAIFRTYSSGRYVNYQVKFQQVILFLLIGALINLAIADWLLSYQIMLFVPVLAFFVAHYILVLRKKWQAEIIFVFIVALSISFGLALYSQWFFPSYYVEINRTHVNEIDEKEIFEGKKMLVLGDQIDYYQYGSLSTPFLNWQLSSYLFIDPNYYSKLDIINHQMMKDLPDIIVDIDGLLPTVFGKLPLVAVHYAPMPKYPSYYKKITPSN